MLVLPKHEMTFSELLSLKLLGEHKFNGGAETLQDSKKYIFCDPKINASLMGLEQHKGE